MDAAFVDAIQRTSLQGGVLAAVVWVVCRVVPSLPAAIRVGLWWAVALKFLVGLAWTTPVAIPLREPAPVPSVAAALAVPREIVETGATAGPSAPVTLAVQLPAVARPVPLVAPSTTQLVVAAWFVLLVGLAFVAFRRMHVTARAVRGAVPASAALDDVTRRLAQQMCVQAPRVLVSDEVASPLVRGLWRPVIVLPSMSLDALSAEQQAMVVCHELVHIRRRDLWAGVVPDMARLAFFFHPLAHLAVREYRLAREAACDAEVLQTLGAEPRDYGRLLLTLGVSSRQSAFAAAGASRSFTDMKRRLQMLTHDTPSPHARRFGRFLLGGAAMALLPIQIVARPIDPWLPARTADVTLSSSATVTSTGGDVSRAIPPAVAASASRSSGQGRSEARDDRAFDWMLLRADGHTVAGSDADRARVRRYQKNGEPLLWVRIDGREHVIRDASIIRAAEAAFDEVEDIGRRMGEVGGAQGRIGARQAETGAKQAAVAARQAELGAKIAELAQRQAALALEKAARALQRASERRDVRAEATERDFEAQMDAFGKQMEALGSQIEALARPMEDFGRQMAPLAAQLEAMGKEIKVKVKEAEAQVRALVERAIAEGKADVVK